MHSDDPQMPGLIPLIKKIRPDVPIIYRSHIEIRSDLVHVAGSPQEEVWKYLWNNIQHADLFISHPVNKFVPSDVPPEKLALLGAATDWCVYPKNQSDWLSDHVYVLQARWSEQGFGPLGLPILHGRIQKLMHQGEDE